MSGFIGLSQKRNGIVNQFTSLGIDDNATSNAVTIDASENVTITDGAHDFDVASHDGSNGLKLGGTLVTSSATELNLLDGVGFIGKLSFTTKTGTATLSTSEKGVIIANKSSAFTINLPAVSGNSGLFYHIKSIGAGAVTVDGNSSETIDGQTTQVLTQWNNMYVITNGTTWYIL